MLLFLGVLALCVKSYARPADSRVVDGVAWLSRDSELEESSPGFYEMWQRAYYATSHSGRFEFVSVRIGWTGRGGWEWNPRRPIRLDNLRGEAIRNVGDFEVIGPDWLRRFAGVTLYRSAPRDGNAVAIHHGLLACAALCLPLAWVRVWARTRHRARRALCPRCGYDLRATPERCPECGASAA